VRIVAADGLASGLAALRASTACRSVLVEGRERG
jgi:hypothetical protein